MAIQVVLYIYGADVDLEIGPLALWLWLYRTSSESNGQPPRIFAFS